MAVQHGGFGRPIDTRLGGFDLLGVGRTLRGLIRLGLVNRSAILCQGAVAGSPPSSTPTGAPVDGSIAVFYGAGHMDDLEQRVASELGYKPDGEIWMPAFSVDIRKTGLTPFEAQWMRNIIDKQMDQIVATQTNK